MTLEAMFGHCQSVANFSAWIDKTHSMLGPASSRSFLLHPPHPWPPGAWTSQGKLNASNKMDMLTTIFINTVSISFLSLVFKDTTPGNIAALRRQHATFPFHYVLGPANFHQ
jgi:hypothetical protein